jgi:hypothetical protein
MAATKVGSAVVSALGKAAAAAATCMLIAAVSTYLLYATASPRFAVQIVLYVSPAVVTLLIWRRTSARLLAFCALELLSVATFVWVAGVIFHDGL